MYIGLHVKYPLFLSDCNETHFLDKFSRNIKKLNFIKSSQWEPGCSIRTDRKKLIVALLSYTNAALKKAEDTLDRNPQLEIM
jgi:hypothetical protein